MSGEAFLRGLATEITTEADLDFWWQRFSFAFEPLDPVGAIDEGTILHAATTR